MPYQRVSMGVSCLLFLCPMVLVSALPNPQTLGDVEFSTDLGPLALGSTTPPTPASTTTTDRNSNPAFNVWEYAYVHDGPINTRAANPEPVAQQQDNRGNQCLWAIVSCCNAHTNYERDNCFEALGCPGAWFQNLCSQEYIDAANNQVTSIFSGGFGKK